MTFREIDGETVETMSDFIFWAPKSLQMMNAATKLKDARLLLGRKAMAKLDRILKRRNITLSTKVHLLKAMVFPVVMYGCESWTKKKAERRRTDVLQINVSSSYYLQKIKKMLGIYETH